MFDLIKNILQNIWSFLVIVVITFGLINEVRKSYKKGGLIQVVKDAFGFTLLTLILVLVTIFMLFFISGLIGVKL